ncbi:MAG: hypothetical protein EBV03_09510 [Proteobacteria bacterium]|nr:hypothetical protein [Pseudomonadota bacterium]
MKKSTAKMVIALLLFVGVPAQSRADMVDFDGPSVDMGFTSVGQYGHITNFQTDLGLSDHWGKIPAKSKIIFTYSFSGTAADLAPYTVSASGEYDYTEGGDEYYGGAYQYGVFKRPYGGGHPFPYGFKNGDSDVPLVFATAYVNGTYATTTITNVSNAFADFYSAMEMDGATDGTLNYSVVSALATPLPAAFPMFSAALAGLFGLRWRRNRNASAQ